MIFLHRYLLVFGLLLIFVFALLPGPHTPAYIVNHDKAAHALAFFVMAFILEGAFPVLGWTIRVATLALLAFMIETMQFLFAGRGFSGEDLLYGAVGVALYSITSKCIRLFLKVFEK